MTTINQTAPTNLYSNNQAISNNQSASGQAIQEAQVFFSEDDQVDISAEGNAAYQASSITPDPGGLPPSPDPEPPGT